MGFLSGKRALIVGVASKRSIAWGIADAMHREGAEIALTYQNDKLKGRVTDFAKELGSDISLPLDVSSDDEIKAVYTELDKVWDGLDTSGTPVASGVYFYRLRSGSFTQTRKMTLLR